MLTPAPYPTGADYRDALFSPSRCFADSELRASAPVLDGQGLPKPISGNFATVFSLTDTNGHRWGVKCFTRRVPDQQLRYSRISGVLAGIEAKWRVPCEFEERGILCQGKWYPILKMQWIDAIGLIPFVEKHLWHSGVLARLAREFAALAQDLSERGLAHGDLQHGNLLVTHDGTLKLVDYDGMYVPSLRDIGASEIGHPNYQSPRRTTDDWGPELDRFSAWLIYCSLVALSIDPALWGWLHRDGEEALLIGKQDFVQPELSVGLRAMAESADERLRVLGGVFLPLLSEDLSVVPAFDPAAVPPPSVSFLSGLISAEAPRLGGDAERALSEWLVALDRSEAAATAANDPTWLLDHLPAVEPLRFAHPPVLIVRSVVVSSVAALGGGVGFVAAGVVSTFVIGPLLALMVMVDLLATVLPLRRTPEWKARRRSKLRFRELKSEADRARHAVSRAESGRRLIDRNERAAKEKLFKLASEAQEDEQKELKKDQAGHDAQLRAIEQRLQSLGQSEQGERSTALLTLQQAHVGSTLSGASIQAAGLPGIGPRLSGTLRACGLGSAADFSGFSVIQSQVYMNLRSGYRVHPPGIGLAKAQTLEIWRRNVEQRARSTQPSNLPESTSRAIRQKYAETQSSIERERMQVASQASQSQLRIREKWAGQNAQTAKQVEIVRQDFAKQQSNADVALIALRRQLNSATWRAASSQHEYTAYRGVSYRHFWASGLRAR
jgi:hypothetical protein